LKESNPMVKLIAFRAAALPLAAALILASPAVEAQTLPSVPSAVERPFHRCIESSLNMRKGRMQRISDVARTTKDPTWGKELTVKVHKAVHKGCACMATGVHESTVLTDADKAALFKGPVKGKAAYKPSDKSKAAFQALRKRCLIPLVVVDRDTGAAIVRKIRAFRPD
jgi:hypothetical protein